jgi:hypothetical protein
MDTNKFKRSLVGYDKENIKPDIMKKLNKVLAKPDFDPE